MNQSEMSRPIIVICKTDHARLMQLANGLLDRNPDLADELLNELERALVVQPDAVPENTVRMGSTVEYRSDDGQSRRVTLVYPADADINQGKVSILTPIGTALLGLSEGQSIDFAANDGRRHLLTVLSVAAAHRPTA
jgi:regulator of nucleoside diphosphate kinase